MARAYVALGSNVGDRPSHLRQALALLGAQAQVVAVSPVYETEPVGYADQPWFLNAVAQIETQLRPAPFLTALQSIEQRMGKATPFENGPRTIDLDLLLYDDEVIDEPGLRVPHPRMHERRFVLAPLADVAPEVRHPVRGKTIAELLAALPADPAARLLGSLDSLHPVDQPERR